MRVLKKAVTVMAAVITVLFLSVGTARADDVRIGWAFLFPIPLPIPIYQIPHEHTVVTVGLLFPIPVPLPVYDYPYHRPVGEGVYREGRYGGLQTSVRPESASVFVDGKYFGHSGDFFTRDSAVTLYPGPHRVEFRAEGYRDYAADIDITPGGLVQIQYDLQPAGQGRQPHEWKR